MKTNLKAIYDHPNLLSLYESIGRQDHRTLVLWALDTGKEILEIYMAAFPEDPRPAQAFEAAEAWSRGEIKMPQAKKAARETHEAARDAKLAKRNPEIDDTKLDAAVAAAHAMGQIIGVVHVATHSPAYVAYAVQAAVILNSQGDQEKTLSEAANLLSVRLAYWASADKENRPWANFL
jgi:hypothetical protein